MRRHGVLDRTIDKGYWLPVDADEENRSNWVSNTDIRDHLKGMGAKHVMIVADSCYSGTLTRGVKIRDLGLNYVARLAQMRTRGSSHRWGRAGIRSRGWPGLGIHEGPSRSIAPEHRHLGEH